MSDSILPPCTGKPATDTSTTPATPASRGVAASRRCPRPGRSRPKPAKPYPDFPSSPTPPACGPRRSGARCTTSARGTTPTAPWRSTSRRRTTCTPAASPAPTPEAMTVKDVVNAFLNAQAGADGRRRAVAARPGRSTRPLTDELVARVRQAAAGGRPGPRRLRRSAGPAGKKWGPHRLARLIQHVRSVFKYAFDAGLIDRPVRFGPGFKQAVSKKTMRLHRAKQGPKLFTPEEVRRLLDAAGVQLRAMILLGINCGFGNSRLRQPAAVRPRPRRRHDRLPAAEDRHPPPLPSVAGDGRRAPGGAGRPRPDPKNAADAGLVFLTRVRATRWARRSTTDGPLSRGDRASCSAGSASTAGRGSASTRSRHTFRTVADEAKDQPAADFIMGHEVAAHVQRLPRDDQRRAAEGRRRPRSQVAVRRAVPEVVSVSR